MRSIVHVDMDAFFCAVETRNHPEYRGFPLIVGGYKDSPRAVVSSCSYEARRFGVRSAMPIAKAARLCPDGIFIPPHMALYQQVSSEVHRIFREFTPLVEPVSIDEAFLDMTGCEHFYSNHEAMGHTIQDRIFTATQCTASVGIAPCKYLAKIASDMRKPKGIVIIRSDEVDSVLLPLPVGRLWGVGEKTNATLKRYGIHTVADLRRKSRHWLHDHFGKAGSLLYELARGIDNRPVEPPGPAKSIGHEITFAIDRPPGPSLESELHHIASTVAARLEKDGRYGSTVVLKVRYPDFTTLTRRQSLPQGIRHPRDIADAAISLFRNLNTTKPIRLVGIYITDFREHQQLGLFSDPRQQVIDQLIHQLNDKPSNPRVTKASDLLT